MSLIQSIGCAAVLGLLSTGVSAQQQQPLLQLQGQPYFGGNITLHVTAPSAIGQPVLLALGLDPLPLDAPAYTSKGAFFIGIFGSAFALGTIGANGRLDVPISMPSAILGAEGIPVALQAYVAHLLSNPATLGLDEPYLLPTNITSIGHPLPSEGAQFGDKIAVGDFNSDGIFDVAAGAWFEIVNGIAKAGRVYVMWGPDFQVFTALSPTLPAYLGHFGQGLAVADFDGDGVDDLAVGEGTGGDPPTQGVHGHVFVFRGSSSFQTTPWRSIESEGSGAEAYVFGRLIRAGDVNGDRIPDLVALAPDATASGKAKAGRLEVFLGPGYGPPLLIENPEPKSNDFFGSRVELGDMNGDGVLDIVEASGRAKVGAISQAGRLHVFDGTTLSLLSTIDSPHPNANDRFGEGLMVCDLDGDSVGEVVASDVKNNFYVIRHPLASEPILSLQKPPTPNPSGAVNEFGLYFAAIDINKDGHVDIVAADPVEGDVKGCGILPKGGAIYAFLAPYFSTSLRFVIPGATCGDAFSWDLSSMDVDGDAVNDVISGNPSADVNGLQNAGRVIIVR